MKRTEALEILREEFRNYDHPDSIAERALSCVEIMGMLPPETTQEDRGLIRNEWTDIEDDDV